MFVLIADDFLTLFLCNVFYTKSSEVDYYISMADLLVSFFVEQMSAFNAIFVAIIINYFSSER